MKRIHLAIEGIVAATLATAACGDTTSTNVGPGTDAGVVDAAKTPVFPVYTTSRTSRARRRFRGCSRI